ncbi:MAG: acetyltransferase [Leptolyngbya sp. Prado105]|nr:acetyltransferase [Leptolyngbya sp. Prado105]
MSHLDQEARSHATKFKSFIFYAFVDWLFQDPAVTKIQTDPAPENDRAIRCYRQVGFVGIGEVITSDGSALPMVKERSQ